MKSIQTMVESFSANHMKKLAKLTAQLQEHLCIDYFCYQKVTASGQWLLLGNNPDWLHFSADNQFYKNDPSLAQPKNTKAGYFFPELYQEPDFQKTFIDQAILKFGLLSSLVSIKKSSTFTEYFIFSSRRVQSISYPIYLNHLNLLTNVYTDYFKQESNRILLKLDDHGVDLNSISDSPFAMSYPGIHVPKVNGALLAIGEGNCTLTDRELDCIQLYAKGLTAKQAAKFISISHRTIEEHLQNAKDKLKLNYKHQLLRHPVVLEYMDRLP
jgi:DNA-binding CsgD family transcriptional regulator